MTPRRWTQRRAGRTVGAGAGAGPDVSGDGGQRAVAPAQVRRYLWSRSYSAAEYLARLSTYSGHRAASADQRQQLFADVGRMIAARPGGCVRKHYLNVLEVARRRLTPPTSRPKC